MFDMPTTSVEALIGFAILGVVFLVTLVRSTISGPGRTVFARFFIGIFFAAVMTGIVYAGSHFVVAAYNETPKLFASQEAK